MRYEDVEKVPVAFGFECVRSKGSHQQFRHPGGRISKLAPPAYPA
ncbi:type II toxin-antitoxin system HicA family toxin [Thermus sp.]|nr:type II toxin-antitoxin system HicA family toxin [Thermus sp.]MCX7850910.1 type II toxin-antitoxin system HicA family toxin [Thermus sp.]